MPKFCFGECGGPLEPCWIWMWLVKAKMLTPGLNHTDGDAANFDLLLVSVPNITCAVLKYLTEIKIYVSVPTNFLANQWKCECPNFLMKQSCKNYVPLYLKFHIKPPVSRAVTRLFLEREV